MDRSRAASTVILLLLTVGSPASGAEVDSYLPPETVSIVSVDVRQVLAADLVRKHAVEPLKAALERSVEAKQVLAATGIDPFRDVVRVVAAFTGGESWVAVAHGAFDLKKIHASAAESARRRPETLRAHREGELYVYESKGTGRALFGAFLDEHTAVVAPSRAAIVALAARGPSAPPAVNPELINLAARVDGKADVWLVSLMPAEFRKQLAEDPRSRDLADKIVAMSGTVNLERDVQVAIQVHTADKAAADAVAGLLDRFKSFAKLMAANNDQFGNLLGGILEGLRITPEATGVQVTVGVSEEMIEKALKAPPAPPPPPAKRPAPPPKKKR